MKNPRRLFYLISKFHIKSQIGIPQDLCKHLIKSQLAVVDLAALKVNKHQNEGNLSQVVEGISEIQILNSTSPAQLPSLPGIGCYAVQSQNTLCRAEESFSMRTNFIWGFGVIRSKTIF